MTSGPGVLAVTISEPVAIALIGVLAAIAAGIPAVVAAVITARTRRENSEQHGESQTRISELTDAIHGHGITLGHVRHDVSEIRERTDDLSARMGAAEDRISRRRRRRP
jgi:hypothetical protein